jgi:hypothetical protein
MRILRTLAAVRLPHAVLVVILCAAAGFVADSAVTPGQLTLIDPQAGYALTAQVGSGAFASGHIAFFVPSRGVYIAETGSALRELTPTSTVVKYEGPASLRPSVNADGTISGSIRRPTTVQIRLQAQLDRTHRTGEATLDEGTLRYHLVVSAAGKGALAQALGAFEDAIVRDDGAAVYDLMNGDITSRYTRDAFAQNWSAQATSTNKVVALKQLSVGDPVTTDSGMTTVIVVYSVSYTTPGGRSGTATWDAYFIRQGVDWKLFFTRPR